MGLRVSIDMMGRMGSFHAENQLNQSSIKSIKASSLIWVFLRVLLWEWASRHCPGPDSDINGNPGIPVNTTSGLTVRQKLAADGRTVRHLTRPSLPPPAIIKDANTPRERQGFFFPRVRLLKLFPWSTWRTHYQVIITMLLVGACCFKVGCCPSHFTWWLRFKGLAVEGLEIPTSPWKAQSLLPLQWEVVRTPQPAPPVPIPLTGRQMTEFRHNV